MGARVDPSTCLKSQYATSFYYFYWLDDGTTCFTLCGRLNKAGRLDGSMNALNPTAWVYGNLCDI